MPVPIASTLGILGDNLRKRGSALPLSRRAATAWTRGPSPARRGDGPLYRPDVADGPRDQRDEPPAGEV